MTRAASHFPFWGAVGRVCARLLLQDKGVSWLHPHCSHTEQFSRCMNDNIAVPPFHSDDMAFLTACVAQICWGGFDTAEEVRLRHGAVPTGLLVPSQTTSMQLQQVSMAASEPRKPTQLHVGACLPYAAAAP